jgi:hypothetical protein
VAQQAASLPTGDGTGLPAGRHRVGHGRVAQRLVGEQPGDRRQAAVDCGRRVAGVAPVADREHVVAAPGGPASQRLGAAGSQVAQQDLRRHLLDAHALAQQPVHEVQQVKGVGADRARRIPPVGQVAEVVIDQPEPSSVAAGKDPVPGALLKVNLVGVSHTGAVSPSP